MIGRLGVEGKHPAIAVTLNGELIPVTSIELRASWDQFPEAVVAFPVIDGLSLDLDAHFTVDDQTRNALIQLGWQPPAED